MLSHGKKNVILEAKILLYRIRNFLLENKIKKINATVNRFLLRELSEQKALLKSLETKNQDDIDLDFLDKDVLQHEINVIQKHLKVINRYAVLLETFQRDQIRRYMVNHNFFLFLKAIELLHNGSSLNIEDLSEIGVYCAIDKVEKAFAELTN